MRKMKKFAVVALGLALLITISLFLPAGAAVTTSRNPEVKSQELVVCETGTSGVIEKVRVIDTMSIREQSGGGSITVKETNEFAGQDPKKITGVNSFLKPSLEGDYIVWNDLSTGANSNNVVDTQFSKAMVDEAKSRIPLDVTYKYFFNGQLVGDPKDIVGKTGHFRLEATFKNTSAEKMPVKYKDPNTGETVISKTDVYLPLVIQPYDWKFDNQHFFNLETDPTSVTVPMPECYQPGWTIPLFPPATDEKASIWVEADVKDFRMPALTLVVAFVFPQTNQKDALEQLTPGIKALYEGIKTLDAGLATAVTGLGSAATPDTLIYGISQVTDGLMTLSSNTEGLGYAKSNIDNGLVPGVDQLYGGTDLVLGGLAGLKAGVGDPSNPTSLMGGLTGINQAIGSTGTDGTLLYATNLVAQNLNLMSAGLTKLIYGLNDHPYVSPTDPGGLVYGLSQMKAGLNAPYNPGPPPTAGAIAALQAMAYGIGEPTNPDSLLNQVDAMYTTFTQDYGPGIVPPFGTVKHVVLNMTDPAAQAMLTAMLETNPGGTAIAQKLAANRPSIVTMYQGLVAAYPYGLIEGMQHMSDGLQAMIDGLTAPLPDGAIAGLQYMKAGIGTASTPETLLYALARMQFGLQQISGGIGDPTTPNTLLNGAALMSGGIDQLAAGTTVIKYGLSSGSMSNPGVKEGLVQLSGGLGTAIAGLGSASTPDTAIYGTNLIQEGMVTLQDGLTQATAEGTQVMITTLDGSIATLNLTQGELDAIKERAAEFNAFLSRPTDGESEVRFIYQTPATYKYTDSKTSGYVALIISLLIAAGLILLGLFAFRKLA